MADTSYEKVYNSSAMKRQDRLTIVYKHALEITWLAVIFLVPLFFNPQSHQAFYLNKALLLQFLVVAMLAFWVADWMLSRTRQRQLKSKNIFCSPLHLSILVFGLLAVLATAASITPAISFWGSYFRKAGLLTLVCWILFFLIVAQQLRTKAQLFRAIYVLLASSGIVSYLGILQYFFPDVSFKLFHSAYTSRIFSTTGNALSLSAFLAMVIPFNLALMVYSWNKITSTCHPERQRRVSKPSARLTTSQILRSLRSRFFASLRMTGGNTEQSSHNSGKWANIIRLIGLVILLALQFWCLWLAQYSITILLYIIAPIIFIILLGIVKRKRLMLSLGAVSLLVLGIIAGLLLAPLLFPTPGIETPSSPQNLESVPISENLGLQTLGWRVQFWRSTIDILLKSPEVPFSNDRLHFLRKVIGYGPETFIVTFQLFFPDKLKSSYTHISTLVDHPHNHYLYLAATTGLPGLISFMLILAAFLYLCFRYLRRATADIDKLLLIAMAAGMVQYMADIFFNPSTISPELVFWLSLGLVPVIGRLTTSGELEKATALDSTESDNSQKFYVNKIRHYISAGCALLLILIGTGITVRPFLADMYLQKGLNQARRGEQAVYAFCKAVKIEPGEAAYRGYLGAYNYSIAQRVTGEPRKAEILSLATVAYKEARELEPYIAYRYYFLADAYTYWAETGAVDKWPAALSLYDEASQLFPRNAVILNKWSLALAIKGDLDEARTKLDYAESIDPGWAETSFLSGLLLAKEGKNDEAALQIMAPIRNKSANLDYFIDLCINLDTYDMVRPLQNALDAYLPSAPREWTGHAILGITSLFSDNLDKSVDELNTAMTLVPDNDVGDLFRAILKLSNMSPPLRAALPNMAEEWRAKLAQSPERDTLLPELDQLISNPK